MRNLVCTMVLLLVTVNIFGQKSGSQISFSKQDYLEKSKNQKKTGTILLISGAVLIATAFIIPRGEIVEGGTCIGPYCDYKYKNDAIKSVFGVAGVASALGSIPFFILSKKNKQRSVSLNLNVRDAFQLSGAIAATTLFPGLQLKINF